MSGDMDIEVVAVWAGALLHLAVYAAWIWLRRATFFAAMLRVSATSVAAVVATGAIFDTGSWPEWLAALMIGFGGAAGIITFCTLLGTMAPARATDDR